jgi:hypothetical protein
MKPQPSPRKLPRWLTVWNERGAPERLAILNREHSALLVRRQDGRKVWITLNLDHPSLDDMVADAAEIARTYSIR